DRSARTRALVDLVGHRALSLVGRAEDSEADISLAELPGKLLLGHRGREVHVRQSQLLHQRFDPPAHGSIPDEAESYGFAGEQVRSLHNRVNTVKWDVRAVEEDARVGALVLAAADARRK